MKKTLKIFSIIILSTMLCSNITIAQFLSNGKITFEKRTNVKLKMTNLYHDDRDNSDWVKTLPPTVSSYFTLCFTPHKTAYRFDKHQELKNNTWLLDNSPGSENVVTVDYQTQQYTAKKGFYETSFLIQDSIPYYDWKIEDEIRVIAGYPCRKATTTIMDSLVIVAFYTDEIISDGGPESFNGLPGMILGLAIPKLYTTWFATSVEIVVPTEKEMNPNFKGKNVTYEEVFEQINKSLKKNWGVYSKWYIKI